MINRDIYKILVNDIENPVGLEFNEEQSIKMKNHFHPWSIKVDEFLFLYNTIKQNNLKNGYEVATAFGVSALAAGLAMKETGGKLVTMDAYIEEKYNHAHGYRQSDDEVYYENNDGYKNVKYFIKKFNLEKNLIPEIGWSPNNTYQVLSKNFDLDKEKLDYVFIDAGHWDEAVMKDVESVIPFLSKNCYIFLHDVHAFSKKVDNFLISKLGKTYKIVVPIPTGFNLALLKLGE